MRMEEEKKIEIEDIDMTIITAGEDAAVTLSQDELPTECDGIPEGGGWDPSIEDTERKIEQLKKFTEEDEDLHTATKTLRSILGGDFLTANFVRKQLPLVIMIFICFFVHISLRYINQKELIEIDKLKKQLEDARFNALTRFSELTAKSRQSYIEQFLKQKSDSTLQTATQPPYIIHLHSDDGNFASPVKGTEETTNEVYNSESQEEVIE